LTTKVGELRILVSRLALAHYHKLRAKSWGGDKNRRESGKPGQPKDTDYKNGA